MTGAFQLSGDFLTYRPADPVGCRVRREIFKPENGDALRTLRSTAETQRESS